MTTKTLLTNEVLEKLQTLSGECRIDDILNTIYEFIKKGTEQETFTEQEARRDLQIALWIAFGNNNYDDYEHYCSSVQWLEGVEDLAAGCGVWYYRYAFALMYTGKLEKALDYAERGVLEEADYPWGWLQLSALRCHFGDREGALAAVARGLELAPGDYEFLQRRREIEEGRNLEEMANHYIDEEADSLLVSGELQEDVAQEKLQAVRGILCDRENLEAVKKAVGVSDWEPDCPYCNFTIPWEGQELECAFCMNEAAVSKFAPAWCAGLRGSLTQMDEEARKWLEESGRSRAVPSSALLALAVERDKTVTLFYSDPLDPEEEFSVSFDRDLHVDRMEQENYAPELYDEEEVKMVETHIEKYFGEYQSVFHELVSPDIHVDICLIAPTEERNYYTLVTCGMGAHRMRLPAEVNPKEWGRAELLICLPPDWNLQNEEEIWYWPIRCLKSLARLPVGERTWLCRSHTVSCGAPFAENMPCTGSILLGPQNAAGEAAYCTLPNGEDVNFYQVFPLYEEEIQYKLEYGVDALLKPMADVDHVVDIHRPNTKEGYAPRPKKQFYMDEEEILPMLEDWDGPMGCLATDRILVDGCRVGCMYRETPDKQYPDSGWRFKSGDESDEYMDNPDNLEVCSLNTICNYDPDVLPLLKAPEGSAFLRDEDGVLK